MLLIWNYTRFINKPYIYNMIFKEFREIVLYDKIVNRDHNLRMGQILMNYLYEVWPTQYKRITGTTSDCFYDDTLIGNTLELLEREWSNYPN